MDVKLTGRPAKLRSGGWGAYIDGGAAVGDAATITDRGGRSWVVEIEAVIWSDGATTLCRTRDRLPDRSAQWVSALLSSSYYAPIDAFGDQLDWPYSEPNHDCMGDFGDW